MNTKKLLISLLIFFSFFYCDKINNFNNKVYIYGKIDNPQSDEIKIFLFKNLVQDKISG